MNSRILSGHALLTVLDSLESGIIILDRDQRILYWNQWCATRSSQISDAAIGQTLSEVFAGMANPRLIQAVAQAITHHLPALLSPALHGAILPLYQTEQDRQRELPLQQLLHIIPLNNLPEAACLIQISDVTANISRERLLRQQSETLRKTTTQDALTGLANRHTFNTVLDHEFAKAQKSVRPLAVIIGDLDQFNQINSQQSREAGDGYLKQVAKIIRNAAKVADVNILAARYGGDEFALILPGFDQQSACSLAKNICLQVSALNISNPRPGKTNQLTMSLGVSLLVPGADSDTESLLSSVEVALYQAIGEGQNQAVFFSVEDGNFISCM